LFFLTERRLNSRKQRQVFGFGRRDQDFGAGEAETLHVSLEVEIAATFDVERSDAVAVANQVQVERIDAGVRLGPAETGVTEAAFGESVSVAAAVVEIASESGFASSGRFVESTGRIPRPAKSDAGEFRRLRFRVFRLRCDEKARF